MEKTLVERVRKFNRETNRLPQKVVVIACVLLLVGVFIHIFPYIAPFVVALVLSVIMSPLVNLLCRLFAKIHLPRALASLVSMIIVFGLLILIVTLIASRAFVELKSLALMLPKYASDLVTWLTGAFNDGMDWLSQRVELITDDTINVIRDYLNDLGRTLVSSASSIANFVARRAVSTAISVPQIILFVTLSIMGTFYMSTDKDRILGYFKGLLPERASKVMGQMKKGLFRAVAGQLKAQVILTTVLFLELLVGLSILRVNYALLLALVIALLDALPVIGSGLFLIPWSLFGFVTGDMRIGIGMLLLYGVGIVVRQLLEPRVVGAQLGIYPLATMMSMYAGFVFFGFLGMLFGPMIFMLCRVAVLAVTEDPASIQPAPTGVDLVVERAQGTVKRLKRKRQRDSDQGEGKE